MSDVVSIARILINNKMKDSGGLLLTSHILREEVDKAAKTLGVELSDAIAETYVRELEAIFTTWIDKPQTLDDGNHVPWLPQKMADINWSYWNRYRQFLTEEGWAEATVRKLEEITRDTLGRLEDPARAGSWDIRGMVVGHVQSGKTANYTGLICRAIDSGYKVIVVLAGIHNSLRSQTQIRLDEGLLGFDSVHNLDRGFREPIGVGRIAPCSPIDTITTRKEDGDFRQAVARQFNVNPGGHPLLFVIKKNGTILRHLLEWVKWSARGDRVSESRPLVRDIPLLVIDDEADYGSVDTGVQIRTASGEIDEEYNPKVINKRLRQLLYFFEKSAYVGYTATPFANIYIHHKGWHSQYGEDLFPRNFITALPAPSNYIGPERVFGIRAEPDADIEEQEGLPVVRLISDADSWMPSGHRMDHLPRYEGRDEVPPSLRHALLMFILTCAGRRARGQEYTHNSMLVHVTRFVDVQARVQDQIKRELSNIQHRLQYGDGSRAPGILDELQKLWNDDFVKTSAAIADNQCPCLTWDQVKPHVVKAGLAISSVRQINGTSGDILDYLEHKQSGLNVIAIGGDKLSRGLTLEGLSISYFLRTSRMYDTLMQMGRWFGYRPGYSDLCRLFTTQDLRDWFRHITFANAELRQEFKYMEAINGKPSDFGLRVRSHPSLLVTAPVKMRQGTELQISYAGVIFETVVFDKQSNKVIGNYNDTKAFLERLTSGGYGPVEPEQIRPARKIQKWSGKCWQNIPAAEICKFLSRYSTHTDARKVNGQRLSQYIEKQVTSPKEDLKNWTVYLATGDGRIYSELIGQSMGLVLRDWHKDFNPQTAGPQPCYHIRRLLSPLDESVDLGESAWDQAMQVTIAAWTNDNRPNKRQTPPEYPAGWALRHSRSPKNGLLLIYPLEPDAAKSEAGPGGPPIIGLGVSFPGNPNDEKIAYIVNAIYLDQEYGDLE